MKTTDHSNYEGDFVYFSLTDESDTYDKHRNMVDAYTYSMATREAKVFDDYILMCIQPKPKYLPYFIYMWLIKKIIKTHIFKFK